MSGAEKREPARLAVRGRLLSFLGDPGELGEEDCCRHLEDGLLVVEAGRIAAVGEAAELLPTLSPDVEVHDHRGRLVMPGLIDTHIHFPQTQVIASGAADLLDWLERHTFVEEQRFADPGHAARVAASGRCRTARCFRDRVGRHRRTRWRGSGCQSGFE